MAKVQIVDLEPYGAETLGRQRTVRGTPIGDVTLVQETFGWQWTAVFADGTRAHYHTNRSGSGLWVLGQNPNAIGPCPEWHQTLGTCQFCIASREDTPAERKRVKAAIRKRMRWQ